SGAGRRLICAEMCGMNTLAFGKGIHYWLGAALENWRRSKTWRVASRVCGSSKVRHLSSIQIFRSVDHKSSGFGQDWGPECGGELQCRFEFVHSKSVTWLKPIEFCGWRSAPFWVCPIR